MPRTSPSPPTASDVARIIALDDRVVRNLHITECYADLSAALRARTGSCVDWCGFSRTFPWTPGPIRRNWPPSSPAFVRGSRRAGAPRPDSRFAALAPGTLPLQ